MKFIYLLLSLSLLTGELQAQQKKTVHNFEIRGQLNGLKSGDTITLYSYDRDQVLLRTTVKDGMFVFKGSMESAPEILALKNSQGQELGGTILLGNETLNISGDVQQPVQIITRGSNYQKGWQKITAIQQHFSKKADSLNKDYEKNKSQLGMIRKEEDAAVIAHVKLTIHQDYAALMYLSNYKKYVPKDTLAKLYSKIPKAYLNSKYTNAIQSYLHQSNIGDAVTGFSAMDPSGKQVDFSSIYTQKPTLLLFTAAWCQPCVVSIPELKRLHQQYADVINIVSFSIDASKELWLKKIKDQQIGWANLWDGKAAYSPTFTQYGFTAIPSYLLVNTKGIIIDKGTTGYEEGQYFKLVEKLALKKTDQ